MVVGEIGRSSARVRSGGSRAICICVGDKFQAVVGDTGEDCRGKEVMRRSHGTDRSARVPIPS